MSAAPTYPLVEWDREDPAAPGVTIWPNAGDYIEVQASPDYFTVQSHLAGEPGGGSVELDAAGLRALHQAIGEILAAAGQ